MLKPVEFLCEHCGHEFEEMVDIPRGEGVSGRSTKCVLCHRPATSVISATTGWVDSTDRTKAQLVKRSAEHTARMRAGGDEEVGGRKRIMDRNKKIRGVGGWVPPEK